MTNALYPLWKRALMQEAQANKSLDQADATNGCYAVLLTTGAGNYVYSDAHQFYPDLNHFVGTPGQITTPTLSSVAIFDGDDMVFVNVSGGECDAIVIYRRNSGVNSTWRLVMYEDTGIIGFPITPNGGNIIIRWNAQGIFQL